MDHITGVYRVSASRRTGTVVVRGDMRVNASTLQRRLEYYIQRSVTIVIVGGRPRPRRSYSPPAAYPCPYPYPYLAQPPPPPYYRLMNGLPIVFNDTIPDNACTIM
jgi:hypothetical protein